MTAKYAVLAPLDDVQGEAFAIVADDTHAQYLFPDGSDSDGAGLDGDRITRLAQGAASAPQNADEWLSLASDQVGYVQEAGAGDAPTFDDAVSAAQEALSHLPTQEPALALSSWAPPTTRSELLAWQRQMMDEWAQEYPEAAAGDVDDPDADLALAQMLTPPTDPEKPHPWLPLSVGDEECGFCQKMADDAIHAANKDTITRGSN